MQDGIENICMSEEMADYGLENPLEDGDENNSEDNMIYVASYICV